ncbi:MAG: hypothetical protein HC892_03665 [Saprospiraceae bacterium]|nr:hypothetical protein [Saprospiraceae bacterium]
MLRANHPCGTLVSEDVLLFMNNIRSDCRKYTTQSLLPSNQMALKQRTTIPITVHIIRRSDGSGGISTNAVENAIVNTNAFFKEAGMEFFLCNGVRLINDNDLSSYNALEDEFKLISRYNVPNVINVYFAAQTLVGEDAPVCGYTYLPSSRSPDIVVINNSCATTKTLPHELGHYFGLFHSHGKSNCGKITDELVDKSNCQTAGDDVCDTPADPNLRQGSNCETFIIDRNCNYTGTLKDQTGNLFVPDVTNIMSYSYDVCRTRFTAEQAARMVYFKDNFRDYLTCSVGSAAAELSLRSEMNVTPSTLVCNQPFSITVDIENEGDAAFAGEIVAALYDSEGNFISVIESINFTNGFGIGTSLRLRFESVGIGFTSGRYQVVIFSRNTGASDFQLVSPYVYQNPLFLNANCGSNEDCTTPTGLVATPTYTNISLSWNVASGATEYQTRIRTVGATEWVEGNQAAPTRTTWYAILPCEQYELQVRAICGSSISNYSPSIIVKSEGCNDVYCYASGDYEENWIQKIQLNTLINESGINLGYANFTNRSTILEKGITYNMVLIPGTGGSNASMFWRVWIDFNQDNDFDDQGEQVIQRSTGNRTSVTAAFSVPNGALAGFTRMRVSMASDGFATSCQTNSLGEVEDYTVNIKGTGNTLIASPANLVFNEFGQTESVLVRSNMAWSVTETLDWVTVTAGTGIGMVVSMFAYWKIALGLVVVEQFN